MERKVQSTTSTAPSKSPANPVLVGILHKSGGAKRASLGQDGAPGYKLASSGGIKHQLNGFLKPPSKKSNHVTLAQAAVGRGIRHSYSAPQSSDNAVEMRPATTAVQSTGMAFLDPPQLGIGVESSLSELTSNYLKAQENGNYSASAASSLIDDATRHVSNVASSRMLSRESSLVDLAMLPTLPLPGPDEHEATETTTDPFTFVDFPNHASYDPPPSDDKS